MKMYKNNRDEQEDVFSLNTVNQLKYNLIHPEEKRQIGRNTNDN